VTPAATPGLASVLDPAALYEGDGGRITCGALRCAGQSAHFTGRTTAGQRVLRIGARYAAEFRAEIGRDPRCEDCGRDFLDERASR
jgi:hypothetical protein